MMKKKKKNTKAQQSMNQVIIKSFKGRLAQKIDGLCCIEYVYKN